jgi:hypothetical protein
MKISLSLPRGENRESSSVFETSELAPTPLLKIEGIIGVLNFALFILSIIKSLKATQNKIKLIPHLFAGHFRQSVYQLILE